MKASVVQEFGQLYHWVYVALSWVGDADCMGLLHQLRPSESTQSLSLSRHRSNENGIILARELALFL